MAHWGNRITELRKKFNNISQRELADAIEMDKSLLSVTEKNEEPRLKHIEKICEFFNLKIYEFFMTEEDYQDFGIDERYLRLLKEINKLDNGKRMTILSALDGMVDKFAEEQKTNGDKAG